MRMITRIAGSIFLMTSVFAAEQENLFLVHADEKGIPDGRKVPFGGKTEISDGKLNVKLDGSGSLEYTVYITPDLGTRLHLSGFMSSENLVRGKDDWQNGRIAVRFLDSQGRQTGGWPEVVSVSGSTKEIPVSKIYRVPPGAATLLIEPANFGRSGSVEFRTLELRPVPENLLLAPNPGGIFEKDVKKGNFKTMVADGKLNITIDGPGSRIIHVPIERNWKSLKLEMKMKTEYVQHGDADWKDARAGMRFDNGKSPVGPWPDIFRASGTTDWKECSRIYEIPEGAKGLNFEPANFGTSGCVEFRNIKLTVEKTNDEK